MPTTATDEPTVTVPEDLYAVIERTFLSRHETKGYAAQALAGDRNHQDDLSLLVTLSVLYLYNRVQVEGDDQERICDELLLAGLYPESLITIGRQLGARGRPECTSCGVPLRVGVACARCTASHLADNHIISW